MGLRTADGVWSECRGLVAGGSGATVRGVQWIKDALHNSCEAVVARIGMGYKAFFAANSRAIGKKNNAVDRPSPCCHSLARVMQSILNSPKFGRVWFGVRWRQPTIENSLRSQMQHTMNSCCILSACRWRF
jgi:hypothetical protein